MCILDQTDDASIRSACRYVEKKYGRCDAVIAAAGTGVAGNMETVLLKDAEQVFDVNGWGMMRVAQAFTPLLRRRRLRRYGQDGDTTIGFTNGADVNGYGDSNEGDGFEKNALFLAVSSQSGICGLPYNDLYVASKHAMEGMLESWRYTANLDADQDWCRYIHIAVANPAATQTAYGEKLVSRAIKGGHICDGTRAWAEEIRRLLWNGQPVDECACAIEEIVERAFSKQWSRDCINGHVTECIPFRNATSPQSQRVIDGVLRDPAGSSGVYAERFALGRELNRRVREGKISSKGDEKVTLM